MEGSSKAPFDIENLCTPLLTSTSQTQENDLPPLSDRRCIYTVPEPLRCVNEKAYTPQVVAIGPLHHGKKGLEDMEEQKKRYLQYFIKRTGVSKEDYETKIKGKEEELRSCYDQDIGLCGDEFLRIILVDAAFIIEFLLRSGGYIEPDTNDRIFHKPWLSSYVILDMLLLENQLPFFILEYLYATAPMTPSVFALSYHFCEKSTRFYVKRDDLGSSSSFKVEHFVDLIRNLNLPTKEERSKNRGSVETSAIPNMKEERSKNRGSIETLTIPTMTKLREAGVKFKATSCKNLFDICFKDGILEIPHLEIDDSTEVVLRNLIAFEQCHCSDTQYFIDYISLMDYFVNTPNDVELLLKNGIVEHLLGDHGEVSTLINSLGKGVVVSDKRSFYYATLSEELNKYYNKKWNKWKANLKQKYFDTPWKTISVIAATLIIILTLIQTLCSFSQCAQR